MKKALNVVLVTVALALSIGVVAVIDNHVVTAACSAANLNSLSNCVDTNGHTNVNTGSNNLQTSVSKAIDYVMWAVGVVAVIMIIIGGIQYALAAGDEAKVKKARKMIVGSIVGLVVAILAYAITQFVMANVQ